MKRSVITLVAMSSLGTLIAMPTADAVEKTATQTTIVATSQTGGDDPEQPLRQTVKGTVDPSPPRGETVTVRYLKARKDGSWKRLGKHHPKLDGKGVFETSFSDVPRHGVCKLTARYPGDHRYAASRGKVVVGCATGNPRR